MRRLKILMGFYVALCLAGGALAQVGAAKSGSLATTYVRIAAADIPAAPPNPNCLPPPETFTSWDPDHGGFNYWIGNRTREGCPNYVTSPRLPDGVLLTYAELDSCDTHDVYGHVTLQLYDCDRWGFCNSTPLATLSGADNLGVCDAVSTSSLAYTVKNKSRQLLLNVHIDGPAPAFDLHAVLGGVILGYQLQVSPDPTYSTFADVPLDHPQHRWVEALAKAGITLGCGGGNYCPNDPVTRAQMAVFLAKGLGLQWP